MNNDIPDATRSVAEQRAELLRAFRIGPTDLAANRSGRLGNQQRRHLVRSNRITLGLFIGVGLAALALLALVAEKPFAPAMYLVTATLLVALVVGALAIRARLRRTIEDGTVECRTGPVHLRTRGRSGWYAPVEDDAAPVMPARSHVVDSGTYRVYVAPHTQRVVAIEPA